MTHDELDRLAPQLEKNCNYELGQGFPTWSRYAVNQMIERTMNKMAPNWEYRVLESIGSAPQIMLTQYRGQIGHQRRGVLMTDGGPVDV